MSELSLNLTFSAEVSRSDDWLWMEDLHKPVEEVSLVEAAELIDNFFSLEPCEGQQEPPDLPPPPSDVDSEEDLAERKEWIEKLFKLGVDKFQLQYCDIDPSTKSYVAKFKLVRKFPLIPYTLHVLNGTKLSNSVIEEFVTETIEFKDDTVVQLKYPVFWSPRKPLNEPLISGLPPEYKIEDHKVIAPNKVTDIFYVRHWTRYEIVKVKISGIASGGMVAGAEITSPLILTDGTSEYVDLPDGEILVFYNRSAYTHTIQPPQVDEANALTEFCKDFTDDWEFDDQPVYEVIVTYNKCRCSGEHINTKRGEPIQIGTKPGLSETITRWRFLGYVSCSGEEHKDGDVGDPEFYKEKCCDSPHYQLPPCREIKERLSQSDVDISTLRGVYGQDAVLIPVMPEEGYCGTLTTKYEVNSKNCCEDIDPLKPVYDGGCADQIGLDDEVTVCVTPGLPPYRWKTGGGYSMKFDETDSPSNILRSGTVVCGDALVSVEDQCGSTEIQVEQTSVTYTAPYFADGELLVSPGQKFYISVNGGVPPFIWTSDGASYIDSNAGLACFQVDQEFCGMGSIRATDACGRVAEKKMKSTGGTWVEVTQPCFLQGKYTDLPDESLMTANIVSDDGEYSAYVTYSVVGWFTSCSAGQTFYYTDVECVVGHRVLEWGGAEYNCVDNYYNSEYVSVGCCKSNTYNKYAMDTQYVMEELQWACE